MVEGGWGREGGGWKGEKGEGGREGGGRWGECGGWVVGGRVRRATFRIRLGKEEGRGAGGWLAA